MIHGLGLHLKSHLLIMYIYSVIQSFFSSNRRVKRPNKETELVFNDSLPNFRTKPNLHLYFFVEFQQPQQPLSGPEANSPFINRTTSRNGGRGSNMMEMPPPLPVANAGKITFLSTSLPG